MAIPLVVPAQGSASEELMGRVKVLTAPEYAGRGNGTAELEAVAELLYSWLDDASLRPGFGASWTQEFQLSDLPESMAQTGHNVAGMWPGHGELADRFVLVTAHYDHLGRLHRESLGRPEADSYFPGANDNASGVSVVFDLIELLTDQENSTSDRRSVLFVFFSGEEIGLQGSAHFVKQPPLDLDSVDVVLNFDTVGVITENQLYVSGLGTAEPLSGIVAAVDRGDLQLAATQKIWGGSDHMSFIEHKIPALFVFGGPYSHYNRSSDTWQNVKGSDLTRVASFSRGLLFDLITYKYALAWDENFRPAPTRSVGEQENRETWFGSLPDFGAEGDGYALAGVFSGSPAERAGLVKGDVLLEMAGEPVAGLVGFTQILRAHNPGDLVEVVVLRVDTEMRFMVVLGDRRNRP